MTEDTRKAGLTRRGILQSTAVAGVAGAAGGVAIGRMGGAEAQTQPPRHSTEVAPGQLDEYYVFSSSGQSGEVRISACLRCAN